MAQNKVVRFIHGYSYRTSLRVEDYKNIGWLNVENRVIQLRLNHVHKIFYDNCSSYMKNNFNLVSQTHSYSSRNSSHNFHLPHVDSFTSATFYYNAIKDWNSLPSNIRNVKSKFTFKKLVKRHLLYSMEQRVKSDFIVF